MSGHTPGPWRADKNLGCKRITAKRFEQHRQARRSEITCTSGLYPEGEDEANARLIAAAPDLLTAAQTVLAGLNARIEAADPRNVPVFDGIVDLHAAIARASADQQSAQDDGGVA